MHRLLLCLCGVVIAAACDRGSTLESPTGPNPPAPVTADLSGRVTESVASEVLPIGGALLTIADGGNAGKTATTNASGEYSFSALRREAFSVTVSASGYLTTAFPIELRGDAARDFPLSPSTPRTPFGTGVFRVGTEIRAGAAERSAAERLLLGAAARLGRHHCRHHRQPFRHLRRHAVHRRHPVVRRGLQDRREVRNLVRLAAAWSAVVDSAWDMARRDADPGRAPIRRRRVPTVTGNACGIFNIRGSAA